MARLIEIVGSDQYKVASTAATAYVDDLSRVQQAVTDKASLLVTIDAYLPILTSRIDGLNKQLIAISASWTAAMAAQAVVGADLASIVGKSLVNNLQSTTMAYADASPTGKQNQATSAGVSQAAMATSMGKAQEVFRLALIDASTTSDRDISLNDFYTKYFTHLLRVQDRIGRELQSLGGIRDSLVVMRGFITDV
jgi:hypothetical protein